MSLLLFRPVSGKVPVTDPPKAFDSLKGTLNSIVIVILPLSALMRDQVSSFKCKRKKSAFINSEAESIPYHNDILEGKFQLVLIVQKAYY